MRLDFEEVKTYLDYIINYTKFKLYVKIKVNEDVKLNFLKYLNSKNIKIFKNESLKELFLKVNPSIFMATNSSVLLESTIYNCLPFMIKTKNDFSEQFYKDKIVIKITSVKQLETRFKLLPNKDQVIKKIRNKIWIKQSNAYLNYNSKTDFVVDFDNVWKWTGFTRKDNAKRVLEKNFTNHIDFNIKKSDIIHEETAPQVGGIFPEPVNGGQNKETIMLTVNTFKKFCLKANTKKADEIHEYYIKLEELLHETLNEETEELRLQLENTNNEKLKLEEHNIDLKKKLTKKYNNKK
jgi:hypothetical protein